MRTKGNTNHFHPHLAVTVSSPIEEEEYAVYSAIWHTDLFEQNLPSLIFHDFTGVGTLEQGPFGWTLRYAEFVKRHTTQYASLLADFERKNARPYPLAKAFLPASAFSFLSEHQQASTTPIGYFLLSRVGFNVSMGLALVYLGYCGVSSPQMGYLLLFKRAGKKWVKVDQRRVLS